MHVTALVIAVLGCVAIAVIGARFLLAPGPALRDFGVAPHTERALTDTKGVRDITSGLVLLVAWAAGGSTTFGWALVVATLTPFADAVIVLRNGGKVATALGVHTLTAVVLLAAGLLLALR